MNPSDDYKLTDLDYLIGDHHLQMIKASLPYLAFPNKRPSPCLSRSRNCERQWSYLRLKRWHPWASAPWNVPRETAPCAIC